MSRFVDGQCLDDGVEPFPDEVEDLRDDNDDEPYCESCGNMGSINCYCGGDLCVCENNGEMPCPACW